MRLRTPVVLSTALFAATIGTATVSKAENAKIWVGDHAKYEQWLREAEIVEVEDVGQGVTKPRKATLKEGDVVFHAVYKPLKRGRQSGYWESYQAEVAAYELDKLLGLDMVPPTVARRVESDQGSLQLWVEGCKTYKSVEGQAPGSPEFSHQVSRMKTFDNLIFNDDRNAGNFLVDSSWNIVLIDHSRAFLDRKDLLKGESKLPASFDRKLVERLEALRFEDLEASMKGLLDKGQIEALLARRDKLLKRKDDLVAKEGEARVLFN
jgi:hypothetical protein